MRGTIIFSAVITIHTIFMSLLFAASDKDIDEALQLLKARPTSRTYIHDESGIRIIVTPASPVIDNTQRVVLQRSDQSFALASVTNYYFSDIAICSNDLMAYALYCRLETGSNPYTWYGFVEELRVIHLPDRKHSLTNATMSTLVTMENKDVEEESIDGIIKVMSDCNDLLVRRRRTVVSDDKSEATVDMAIYDVRNNTFREVKNIEY